jgi:hypothetical protein
VAEDVNHTEASRSPYIPPDGIEVVEGATEVVTVAVAVAAVVAAVAATVPDVAKDMA